MKKSKEKQDPFSCLRILYPDPDPSSLILDPHFRIAQFHLAILELIEQKESDNAYQIYLDLVSKKAEFAIKEDPFAQEFCAVVQDIIAILQNEGFPVTKQDLDIE